MQKFSAPCCGTCTCISSDSGPSRTFYATLTYFRAGRSVSQKLQITLPDSISLTTGIAILNCQGSKLIKPLGVLFGVVRFRLDGTDKPLEKIERLQDWWFRQTGHGKQITGSHYVHNFPDLDEPAAKK